MIKLSFIVPVYNVEKYLCKCVESLIKQDFSDYEIILVDDGSTDKSPQICDEIVRANDEMSRANALNEPLSLNDDTGVKCNVYGVKIRVIHQANAGLSAARNAGLKAAKGKYVCFVDSDDYWEENVLGEMMEQIEREKLDVLRFDYQNVRIVNSEELIVNSEDGVKYEVFEPNKAPRYIDKCDEVVDGETYLNERMSYACYAVLFIIKRSLIYNDGMSRANALNEPRALNDACLFKRGIYFEDTEWTPRMLVRAKRVNATSTIVYNYLTRSGSITKKYDKDHIRKKNESLMQVNLSLLRLLPTVKDGRWIHGCIADNVHNILNNAATYDYESVSSLVKTIKEYKMLPLQEYKVRKINQLRYQFINMSPRLYCWLRHVRMKCLKK